jgi:flagellin
MRINTNIAALNSYNQLKNTQNNLSKSLSRLSSGKRINGASDDAAGLAISEKMNSQTKGLAMAQRNAQDGISMIQTAEGALKESHSILQRMRELSVQASNDTNTASDRSEIQKEVDQLIGELDRIGNTTEFNTKSLLNGNAGFSADIDASTGLTALSGGDAATGTYSMSAINSGDVAQVGLTKTDADTNLADGDVSTGTFTLNGESVEVTTGTMQGLVDAINGSSDSTGVTAELMSAAENDDGTGTGVLLKGSNVGSTSQIEMSGLDNVLDAAAFIGDHNNGTTDAQVTTVSGDFTSAGTDASAATVSGTSFVGAGNVLTGVGGSLDGIEFKVKDGISGATGDIDINSNNSLTFQIGANTGQDMDISVNDMRSSALNVGSIDVENNAANAITTIDDAIAKVSGERSKLGAYQNRLDHTINNLNTAEENLTAAESRISDVDMAKEMMNFTKSQILSQAGTAMMAQANQLPQGVLQLLG